MKKNHVCINSILIKTEVLNNTSYRNNNKIKDYEIASSKNW